MVGGNDDPQHRNSPKKLAVHPFLRASYLHRGTIHYEDYSYQDACRQC
jgi:hypothetical protein